MTIKNEKQFWDACNELIEIGERITGTKCRNRKCKKETYNQSKEWTGFCSKECETKFREKRE